MSDDDSCGTLADPLVLHDGNFIPVSQARPLLVEELTRHGYKPNEIEDILQRAIQKTRTLLSLVAQEPEIIGRTTMAIAVAQEQRAAARWRAQWRAETQQARAAYKAEYEAQSRRYEQGHQEMLSRAREARKKERKARSETQFERWEEHNKHISEWNEQAEARAAERKREDDRMTYALMKHIREKEERAFWRMRSEDEALNLIGDHEYIQWMFECFSRPSRRWLAVL